MSAGKVILGIGIGVVLVPIIIVGGCAVIFGIAASDSSVDAAEASIKDVRPKLEIDAFDLYSAYEANEIDADERFKKKVLVVTGSVESVGKDITDEMYLSLKGSGFFGVQCFFADRHATALRSIRVGDEVRIKGRCDGKFGNVLVRGCTLED